MRMGTVRVGILPYIISGSPVDAELTNESNNLKF